MSDFVTLAQTFGLPLAMTLSALAICGRVIVVITQEKDKIAAARYEDMKQQFEARIKEQREQYEQRLSDMEEDRDWNRDRLHQAMGITDAGTAAVEEAVRRLAKQLPPRSGR